MRGTGQVLFIQGGGADTHDAWDANLVESLRRALGDVCEVRYPRMPGEDDPSSATWRPAILREVAALDEGSVVIGHSVGGTILIHALAQQPPAAPLLAAVVLIAAPFVGDGGWPGGKLELRSDLGARLPPGMAVHVVHGLEDEIVPPAHADLYARAIPQAHLHLLPGRDHQLGNDLRVVAELIGAGEPRPPAPV